MLPLILAALPGEGALYRRSPIRAGGPAVVFEDAAVVASGLAPGATVYFASLSLKGGDYLITVEKPAGQATADAGGVARLALVQPVRTRSVWVVVDGSTNGYTVACPPGMLLSEIAVSGTGPLTGPAGAPTGLAIDRAAVDVFVIRAGGGIWTAYLRDGGSIDGDRTTDGVVSAGVSALDPDSPGAVPLADMHTGDVVFAVDRNSLQYFVTKVGAP